MDDDKNYHNQTGLEDRDPPSIDGDPLDLDEEFASEVVTDDNVRGETYNPGGETDDPDLKNVYGWIGLALSVISFFIVPVLFAAVGIVLGFIARRGEAKVLGSTAIAVGVISILVRLFLLPLM